MTHELLAMVENVNVMGKGTLKACPVASGCPVWATPSYEVAIAYPIPPETLMEFVPIVGLAKPYRYVHLSALSIAATKRVIDTPL